MKILLHIGTQKTGTTSIQRYLLEKSEILEESGYYYSREATHQREGHHEYAELLQRSRVKIEDFDGNLAETLYDFRKIFNYLNPDKINIVSSEAFQNCDPRIVKTAFEEHEVRVVCYIRNQLDALVSSYAQEVHATRITLTMEEYALQSRLDYFEFLKKWSDVFGSKFSVRVFDSRYLDEGNVICDFFSRFLNLDAPDDAFVFNDSNPSLTNRMLAFKLKLNARGTTVSRIYRRLSLLSKFDKDSGKVRLTEELKSKIIDGYIENQKKWAPDFFLKNEIFDYGLIKTASEYIMEESEFMEILEIIADWPDENPQI